MEEDSNQKKKTAYSVGRKVFVAHGKADHLATVTGVGPDNKVAVLYTDGCTDCVEPSMLTPIDELARSRPKRSTATKPPQVQQKKRKQKVYVEVQNEDETDSIRTCSLFGDDSSDDDMEASNENPSSSVQKGGQQRRRIQKAYSQVQNEDDADSIRTSSLFGDDSSDDEMGACNANPPSSGWTSSPSAAKKSGGGWGKTAASSWGNKTAELSTGWVNVVSTRPTEATTGWGSGRTTSSWARTSAANESGGGWGKGGATSSWASAPSAEKKSGGGWGEGGATSSWVSAPSLAKDRGGSWGKEGTSSSWASTPSAAKERGEGWGKGGATSSWTSPSSAEKKSGGGWGKTTASTWGSSTGGLGTSCPNIVSPAPSKVSTEAVHESTTWPTAPLLPIEAVLGEGYGVDHSALTFPAPLARKSTRGIPAPAPCGSPVKVYAERTEVFFLRFLWGKRLYMKQVKLSRSRDDRVPHNHQVLEKIIKKGRHRYFLICTNHEKDGHGLFAPSKYAGHGLVDAYYLREEGERSISSELLSIANFAGLPASHKTAARMQLLVSTASMSENKDPRAWVLEISDFEFIDDEDKHTGCGFIPIAMLQTYAPGASAAQVRVVCPELGIFKGMLMTKRGIDKIQLFQSMKKVDKAIYRPDEKLQGKAYLLFKNVMPAKTASFMDRQLNPRMNEPPPSAVRDLKSLNSMVESVLVAKGVPEDTLEEYRRESESFEGCKHHSAVGVSDPTGKLPEGSVFVTGFGVSNKANGHDRVFVTRFPCTEANDGHMLPVVRTKPTGMSKEDWDHLCSIHLGIIIFATPQSPGARLLPEMIANGDLDGDYYLIVWDKKLMSHIHDDPIFVVESESEDDDDPLVGQLVEKCVNGKKHRGSVKWKTGERYVVAFEKLEDQILTREQVVGDREFVVGINRHRGQGKNVKVEVLYEDAGGKVTKQWRPMKALKNEDAVEELAEYAVANNLLKTVEWRWVDESLWAANALEILDHREVGGVVTKFKVNYDDGMAYWEELDTESAADMDLIQAYVKRNDRDLTNKKSWSKFKRQLTKAKGEWFMELQDYLVDIDRLMDHTRLMKCLHKLFKNSSDRTERLHFGRAYKQTLDIGKHGGKVDLPFYLMRLYIKEKNLHKYVNPR